MLNSSPDFKDACLVEENRRNHSWSRIIAIPLRWRPPGLGSLPTRTESSISPRMGSLLPGPSGPRRPCLYHPHHIPSWFDVTNPSRRSLSCLLRTDFVSHSQHMNSYSIQNRRRRISMHPNCSAHFSRSPSRMDIVLNRRTSPHPTSGFYIPDPPDTPTPSSLPKK